MESSYVDDPNFTLKFVNKKSSERVLELVDEIKAAFDRPELRVDNSAHESLNRFDDDLSLLIASSDVLSYSSDAEPPQVSPPRLASLKPFLFAFFPATTPRGDDSSFGRARAKFLEESRLEHERLLWSFQDRLVRDLCSADDQFQQSPFQIATVQLAKEQTLPIHLVEKRKVTLQARFSALMKKSQKKAASVIEAQKRTSKIIMDEKQFQTNFEKMQKNELNQNTIDRQYEVPVYCPFSFLCDANFSKS